MTWYLSLKKFKFYPSCTFPSVTMLLDHLSKMWLAFSTCHHITRGFSECSVKRWFWILMNQFVSSQSDFLKAMCFDFSHNKWMLWSLSIGSTFTKSVWVRENVDNYGPPLSHLLWISLILVWPSGQGCQLKCVFIWEKWPLFIFTILLQSYIRK